MTSVNQINLSGNLGMDPESITTKTGKDMTKLNLAVTTGYKDNKQTHWVPVVVFEHTAKFAKQYLKKGDMIFVSGTINQSKRKTKSGEEFNSLSIIGREVTKLKSSSGEGVGHQGNEVKIIEDDYNDIPF